MKENIICERIYKGIPIYLHESGGDPCIVAEVVKFDVYNLEAYKDEQVGIFLDIGSHVGSAALWAGRLWQKAKLIMVEPYSDNTELIRKNVERLGLASRSTIIDGACRYNDAELLIGYNHSWAMNNLVSHEAWAKIKSEADPTVEVFRVPLQEPKKFTVEEIMKEAGIDQIDFLKIDCDGSEWDIFKSMTDETVSKIGFMVGEVGGYGDLGDVWEFKKTLEARFPKHSIDFDDCQSEGKIAYFWAAPSGRQIKPRPVGWPNPKKLGIENEFDYIDKSITCKNNGHS